MTTHELDFLENAIDSLAEELAKFEAGDDCEPKAFKFAVLHMAHFVELVFTCCRQLGRLGMRLPENADIADSVQHFFVMAR